MIIDYSTGCVRVGFHAACLDPIDLGIGIAEGASMLFGAGAEAVGAGAAAVGEGAAAIGEGVGAGVGALGEGAAALGEGAASVVGSVGDTIGAGLGSVGDTINQGLSTVGNTLGLTTPDQALSVGASTPSSAPANFGFNSPGASFDSLGTIGNPTDQALSNVGLQEAAATPGQGIGPNNEIPTPQETMGTPENAAATLQQAAAQGDLGTFDTLGVNAQGDVFTPSDPGQGLGTFEPSQASLSAPQGGGGGSTDLGSLNFSDPANTPGATEPVTMHDMGAPLDPAAAATQNAASPSFLDQALKYGKVASMGLGLGSLALGALNRPKLPKQEAEAEAIARNEKGLAQEFIGDARNNQITPQMQQAINAYVQNAQTQLYQMYAQNGADPTKNSAYQQQLALIQQNAAIMYEKFVDQLFQEGMAAAGGANSVFMGAAKMKLTQDQELATMLGKAASALGGSFGGTNIRIG